MSTPKLFPFQLGRSLSTTFDSSYLRESREGACSADTGVPDAISSAWGNGCDSHSVSSASPKSQDDAFIGYYPSSKPSNICSPSFRSHEMPSYLLPPPISITSQSLAINLPVSNSPCTSKPLHVQHSPYRSRSYSLPDVHEMDCFIQLDSNCSKIISENNPFIAQHQDDLAVLVSRADVGMKSGIDPIMADGAMGGTYFLRDISRLFALVCKPGDEEPNGPWNPHQQAKEILTVGIAGAAAGGNIGSGRWSSYKGQIMPGFGMYREVAAYILDRGFAGVPTTQLARVRHRIFRLNSILSVGYVGSQIDSVPSGKPPAISPNFGELPSTTKRRANSADSFESGATSVLSDLSSGRISDTMRSDSGEGDIWEKTFSYKPCSVQAYVRNECSAEDMGPGKFLSSDVQRIAVLDIRLCNLDRHEGNMLVSTSHPFQYAADHVTDCGSMEAKTFRLIPIDHGYCLPHVLHMSGISFAWMQWPQAEMPVHPDVATYIAALDVNEDICTLRKCLGVAVSEPCLLTLRTCTMLLQKGIAAGLNLSHIGSMMMDRIDFDGGPQDSYSEASALQCCVVNAVKETFKMSFAASSSPSPSSSPPRMLTMMSQRQQAAGHTLCLRTLPAFSSSPLQPSPVSTYNFPSGQSPQSSTIHAINRPPSLEYQLSVAMSFQQGRVLLALLSAEIDAIVANFQPDEFSC